MNAAALSAAGWYLRRMRLDDLPAVMAIDRAAFPTPWCEAHFRNEIDDDARRSYPLVAEQRGKPPRIGGFMIIWHVVTEMHLLSIAVHPHLRGQGIGSAMLKTLVAFSREHGAKEIQLEVRVSNVRAQALYERLGFRQVAVRRKYYGDTQEDGLLMTLRPLPETDATECLILV